MSYKEKSFEKAVGSERSGWLCDLLDASYVIPLLEAVLQNGTVLPWHTNDASMVGNVQ